MTEAQQEQERERARRHLEETETRANVRARDMKILEMAQKGQEYETELASLR
jgi:hypothetical protein